MSLVTELEGKREHAQVWMRRHKAVEDYADWVNLDDDHHQRDFWMGVCADAMEAQFALGTFVGHADAVLAYLAAGGVPE